MRKLVFRTTGYRTGMVSITGKTGAISHRFTTDTAAILLKTELCLAVLADLDALSAASFLLATRVDLDVNALFKGINKYGAIYSKLLELSARRTIKPDDVTEQLPVGIANIAWILFTKQGERYVVFGEDPHWLFLCTFDEFKIANNGLSFADYLKAVAHHYLANIKRALALVEASPVDVSVSYLNNSRPSGPCEERIRVYDTAQIKSYALLHDLALISPSLPEDAQ